ETASQAFAQMHKYDAARPFLPWAIGVARNVVAQHRRRMAKDRHVFDHEVVTQLEESFDDLSESDDDVYRALVTCIEKLPSRSRYVCRLRYESNLRSHRIAEQIGATPEVVRGLLHRARHQ